MTKKTIIITGANSGIGFSLSKTLCADGHQVILACRNEFKGQQSVNAILNEQPTADASFMKLDLTNLSSVRSFAKDYIKTSKPLDILVNNAGVYLGPGNRVLTDDRFELTMASNHLGHFLLTNLFLDRLKSRARDVGSARIVVLSSSLHNTHAMTKSRGRKPLSELDPEDIFLANQDAYSNDLAYKNSKLCNVLMTYHLDSILQGSGVSVNAVCPGFIPETNLVQYNSWIRRFLLQYVLSPILRYKGITATLDEGVQNVKKLVDGDEYADVSGKYFYHGKESTSSEESYRHELQLAVWEKSARYCGLEGYTSLQIE